MVNVILAMIPARYRGSAKTILVVLGMALTYAQTTWADNPRVAAVIAVATMLGVYHVPNVNASTVEATAWTEVTASPADVVEDH